MRGMECGRSTRSPAVNVQCLNSRSERRSIFRQSLIANPFPLAGIVGPQVLHLSAMNVPGLNTMLGISLISLEQRLIFAALASVVLLVGELVVYRWRSRA